MNRLPREGPARFEVRVLSDPAELADAGAREFADTARNACRERGRFRVALSGGSTPRGLYERLAREPYSSRIDWTLGRCFFGDERCVPPDSPRSNFRMVREALLDPARVPPESVCRMKGEEEPRRAADEYEQALRREFGDRRRPRFDLVLLGLGADGHTASLFPRTAALSEKKRDVVANFVPNADEWRLTLTYPALNAARRVVFVVAGADKSRPAARIVKRDPDARNLPAAGVRPRGGSLLWLLDEAAAKEL